MFLSPSITPTKKIGYPQELESKLQLHTDLSDHILTRKKYVANQSEKIRMAIQTNHVTNLCSRA